MPLSLCLSLAQIAGAYYGVDAIDRVWMRDLKRWDPEREIELRAMLLFFAGLLCDPPSEGDLEGEKLDQEQTVSYHSLFPEADLKPVLGPNHPDYVPPPTPTKSFETPSPHSPSKRSFDMFRFFS
jgi:hypothetical protein